MKIAWFTPFHEKSAIGTYSRFAAEALSSRAEVDLFLAEGEEPQETKLEKVFYTPGEKVLKTLEDYDIAVYNMGNYTPNHMAIYDVMKKHPGLLILHDVCMLGFLSGYYYMKDEYDLFTVLVKNLYGPEADRLLYDMRTAVTARRIDYLAFNMEEIVCRDAVGVMVHSRYHEGFLKKAYDGPTTVIPLIRTCDYYRTEKDPAFKGYTPGRTNILTVGHVNWNKLIDQVVAAIAQSRYLKKNVCYVLAGETPDGVYLQKLLDIMRKERLDDCVKILGFVDDNMLRKYYDNADVICNLRWPAMEGGSASIQEQLVQGKPTIVVDTGVYSETPDDCVVKINIARLDEDLPLQLERLVKDPSGRRAMGERAAAWAAQNYSRENYAERFLEFAGEVIGRQEFLQPLYGVMGRVEERLDTLGLKANPGEPRLEAVEDIARELGRMFGC